MFIQIVNMQLQEAIKYTDPIGTVVKQKNNKQLWTECCKRRRAALNCKVECDYSGVKFTCKEGKGCKK